MFSTGYVEDETNIETTHHHRNLDDGTLPTTGVTTILKDIQLLILLDVDVEVNGQISFLMTDIDEGSYFSY
jgi:hypothetical protein